MKLWGFNSISLGPLVETFGLFFFSRKIFEVKDQLCIFNAVLRAFRTVIAFQHPQYEK